MCERAGGQTDKRTKMSRAGAERTLPAALATRRSARRATRRGAGRCCRAGAGPARPGSLRGGGTCGPGRAERSAAGSVLMPMPSGAQRRARPGCSRRGNMALGAV